MKFKSQLQTAMICEEILETIPDDSLELFSEGLDAIETELNEFLGFSRAGDALKRASVAGDKAVAAVKEKGKDVLDTAKYAAGNMAREAGEKIAGDAKAIAQAHVEIAQAIDRKLLGGRVAKILAASQDKLKEIWGKAVQGKLSPEQMQVITELASILQKLEGGKFLSAFESLKVLAAILAGGTSNTVPEYKEYTKQVERLNAIPGLDSIRIAIKKG